MTSGVEVGGGMRTDLPMDLLLDLLSRIPDPVFVKDTSHRWVYVNQANADMIGHPIEALLGKTDHDFFPKREADVFWEKDAEVFRTGLTNVNEETITDRNGKVRTIVTKKSIAVCQDETFLVGVIRDITERKAAEDAFYEIHAHLEQRVDERTIEARQARERLHQAERLSTLGALTGGVAHDFNNLLAVILLANEEILRQPGLSPASLELAAQSLDAARQGAELTSALLAYARQQPLTAVKTDVVGLIRRTMDLLARSLGRHIRVEFEPNGAPLWTSVDPSQLQNAIINLALNARDAMPDGGRLRFVCGEVDSVVEVRVVDEGAGIDPEHLGRIFDPFFTTKPTGKGTGLGLSTVHGFVHQSGGTIAVQSTKGQGTEFCIRLPAL